MLVNLLCLPRSSICFIYQFLDDKSAMRLREVSKSMKMNVDTLIVGIRKICIPRMIFEKNITSPEMIDIGFRFDDLSNFRMWRNFCFSATENRDFTFPKEQHSDMLAITLRAAAMKQLFDDLKPHIEHNKVLSLSIAIPEAEIVRHCLEFMEGKVVPNFRIGHWTAEMIDLYCLVFLPIIFLLRRFSSVYLNFTKQIKSTSVDFSTIVVTEDSVKFLLKISDIVNKLVIIVAGLCNAESASILHSILFIREILKRKCNEFEISVLPDVCMSITKIEKLLQLLHNSDKKVHLHTSTNSPPTDVQIGLYHVKAQDYPNRRRHITISRLYN